MNKYIIKLDWKFWSLILLIITILSINIRYILMSDKFFIDSSMLLYIEQTEKYTEGSFGRAARFFKIINFFDLNTLFEWSIYICVVYFFLNLFILKDVKKIRIEKLLFLILGVFLWYLFPAGITKEVIQSLFYIMILYICKNRTFFKRVWIKLFFGAFTLFVCSLTFRAYYILTAVFSITIFIALKIIKYFKMKRNKAVFSFFALSLMSVFLFMLIIQLFFPTEFNQVIFLKSIKYQYLVASTDSFINDIIANSSANIFIYMINYCTNCIRLLFPVELLMIGKIYYIPFIAYQLMFLGNYIDFIKNHMFINEKKMLIFSFITSFITVGAMMEPDFGSWARHQSVILPLVIECFIVDYVGEKNIE